MNDKKLISPWVRGAQASAVLTVISIIGGVRGVNTIVIGFVTWLVIFALVIIVWRAVRKKA